MNGLGPVTQHCYGKSYQALQTWLARRWLPRMSTVTTLDIGVVSEVLTDYLQKLYNGGRPFSQAPYELAAVQYDHRRLRGT